MISGSSVVLRACRGVPGSGLSTRFSANSALSQTSISGDAGNCKGPRLHGSPRAVPVKTRTAERPDDPELQAMSSTKCGCRRARAGLASRLRAPAPLQKKNAIGVHGTALATQVTARQGRAPPGRGQSPRTRIMPEGGVHRLRGGRRPRPAGRSPGKRRRPVRG